MAEFCQQCAKDLDFEPDFVGLCKEGFMVAVLCEDCGPTYVDHTGKCIGECDKKHWSPEDGSQTTNES
jgi:hypothetical protein